MQIIRRHKYLRDTIIALFMVCPLIAWSATVGLIATGTSTASDTSNTTSYVCPTAGTFTPSASSLLIAFVACSATVATGTMTDSQGLGFTKITSATFSTGGGTLYAFVSNAFAAASTETVTFDCTGDAATGCNTSVLQVTGMNRAGLSAILNFKTTSDITANTVPAPVFPATTNTNNATVGAVAGATPAPIMTPPTSWTEAHEISFSTPNSYLEDVFRNSGFAGTTITWGNAPPTAAGTTAAIILELNTTDVAVSNYAGFMNW